MSKRLLTLYTDILLAANATVDDEGFVSNITGKDKTSPYMVGNKRLILPTPDMLKRQSWDGLIAFHPLRENALKGESEVLESLRETFCDRLSYASVMLILNLLNICASPAEHKLLSPDQQLLLSAVGDADRKTVEAWQDILMSIAKSSRHEGFLHIYLKRRVEIAGKIYDRGGVVTFPFWKEIEKAIAEDSTTLRGRKLRAKDIKAIQGVCSFIFPNIEVPQSYSRGSYSQVAPFTDALMQAVAAIGMRLNDIADQYKDFIVDDGMSRISDTWVEEFNNLDSFVNEIRMIPSLPGNDGAEKQQVETPSISTPSLRTPTHTPAVVAPPAPVQHQPVYAQAPPPPPPPPVHQPVIEQTAPGAASLRSLLTQGQPQQQYAQPQYQQPPPYWTPPPPPQPAYNQPPQQMTPWGQPVQQPSWQQQPPARASLSNPYVQQPPQQPQGWGGQYGMSQPVQQQPWGAPPQQNWGAPLSNIPRGPVL